MLSVSRPCPMKLEYTRQFVITDQLTEQPLKRHILKTFKTNQGRKHKGAESRDQGSSTKFANCGF